MAFKIVVFYGSVRSARKGIRVAKFAVEKLKDRGHEVDLIDPLKYKLPLLDRRYKEYEKSEVPEVLEKLAKKIIGADAYVIVSGEYNHSPPPALLNLLDHFLEEYGFKPSAIVSYSSGSWGGVRAASHLRDTLAEMGMPAIPTALSVPKVQEAFNEDGKALDEDGWNRRSKKFFDEFEWYTRALKQERDKGKPY